VDFTFSTNQFGQPFGPTTFTPALVNMPNPLPEFSHRVSHPYILRPEDREAVLNTDFGQAQRVNIEALIHLYEIGDLGPRQQTDLPVFMVNGVHVEKDLWHDKSVPAHASKWCEICYPVFIFSLPLLIISLDVGQRQISQQTKYQANII
jgi:hypothetical protein